MYSIDLAANAWRNLTGGLQGATPSRRAYHAMATAGQTVYLFGGSHPAGEMQAAAEIMQRPGDPSSFQIYDFWRRADDWQALSLEA